MYIGAYVCVCEFICEYIHMYIYLYWNVEEIIQEEIKCITKINFLCK